MIAKYNVLLPIALFLIFNPLIINSQQTEDLRSKILAITEGRQAITGVSVILSTGDTLSVRGDQHFPMQSVFKFHIGLVVMSEIDKGRMHPDQKITIAKNELLPGLWSPIREKYPEGATLTLQEILEYTISQSDNVGCDVLLRLLGGPEKIELFFKNMKIDDLSVKINEEVMQSNWDLQYLNWTTPRAMTQVLKMFYENTPQLLSKQSHQLLWQVMRETQTGKLRLKGLLPEGTIVAHKTGWSGTHKSTGITAAVNDVGIVFLPDGEYFLISVFVTDAKATTEQCERIIAEVAKAVWDYHEN